MPNLVIEFLNSVWPIALIVAIERCIAISTAIHAITRKRETRAVIGWLGLILLAPLVGSFFYIGFGINRIKRKGNKVQDAIDNYIAQIRTKLLNEQHDHEKSNAEHPQFAQLSHLVERLSGRRLLSGNDIEPLVNGDEAYPHMLKAIRNAKKSVSLQTYIFDSGQMGRQFIAALGEANQRGVDVRVLVDAVGARYARSRSIKLLSAKGVPCARFLPTRIPRFAKYANLRNHRKILVIDGVEGYTGGMNIREGCCLDAQPRNPVQDIHFKIQGPVVTHLQESFVADWAFTTGEMLTDENWFPERVSRGTVWARGISDGPDEDFEKLLMTILGAISVASHRIDIMTPYFLPYQSVIHALNAAALRGVEVNIVLPEKNNLTLVQWASATFWWQLLERDCHVYLSPEPFDHSKLMIVDDGWSMIGSMNWDPRSLRLNFEFNVECYSLSLAQTLRVYVEKSLGSSRRITLKEVNSRSFAIQLRDGLARLAAPYL